MKRGTACVCFQCVRGLARPISADEQRRHQAFTRLVAPELEVLYRAALALTAQAADAEDLLQETLLRAYRAVHNFDGRYPRAWLLTIMRHVAANERRRRIPEPWGDAIETDARASSEQRQLSDPEELVVRASFDDAVAAAFWGLPKCSRLLVRLVDIQGLSIQEAALLVGMREGAVRSRLHRARAKIRSQLTMSAIAVERARLGERRYTADTRHLERANR